MPVVRQQAAVIAPEIDGAALSSEMAPLLVRATVEDSLNLPDMFALEFHDADRTVLDKTGIEVGSAVRLRVTSSDDEAGTFLMAGEVTALETRFDGEGTFTVVRGLDRSHRLFRNRTTATYRNVTYGDVAKRVAQRAGLDVGQIDDSGVVSDHVSQANETDWRFLKRLAQEEGREVVVVEGKLDYRKPRPASEAPDPDDPDAHNPLQLTLGSDLIRLRSCISAADQVKEVHVRGWDVGQKQALVGTASTATDAADIGVDPAEVAGRFGDPIYTEVDTPFGTQAEVDAAASALSDRLAAAFASIEGLTVGSPQLRAGSAVSLGQAGEPFDGRYVLTATRHSYDPFDGYTTSFTASGRHDSSLLALLTSGDGDAGSSRRVWGVVPAQVTDVNDDEELARVKLKFPWLSDDYESDWARAVHLGAGGDRGSVFLPEVDDEVLVAFEHGDIRRPYVVGGLYNGADKPNLGDDLVREGTGEVRRRGIVSKKGAGLVFLDADDAEGVAIFTGDRDLRISLNKTQTKIKVSSSGDVEIEGTNEVKITAGTKLTLHAESEVEMSATTVKIHGDSLVQVEGTPIQLN